MLGNWLGLGQPVALALALTLALTLTPTLTPTKACRVLGNCAFSPEGEEGVATGGCVGPMAAAMRAHPDDASVQEEACDALLNLVGNEAGRAAMLSLDCLALAEAAARAHPSLESARDLLKGLSGPATEGVVV